MSEALLKTSGISFSYPGRPSLFENLSFEIYTKDVVAVLGANGCGKSTLLQLLLGFFHPASGTITARCDFGFVPQFFSTSFSFTVEDVVMMGRARQIRVFGTPKEKDRRVCAEAMETMGILPWKKQVFSQLSGGQQQLVLIARALAGDSPLILLDEPTSALDLGNQDRVLSILKNLAEDFGKTIVFTTHQPNHAEAIANKVLMMQKTGCVFGETKDLMTSASLSTLFGMRIRKSTLEEEERRISTFVPLYKAYFSETH